MRIINDETAIVIATSLLIGLVLLLAIVVGLSILLYVLDMMLPAIAITLILITVPIAIIAWLRYKGVGILK